MRTAFAHLAVLHLDTSTEPADDRAPGGAITERLCGTWEHSGACPLAPHHTATTRNGSTLAVRVLFASYATEEPRVRHLIADALAAGSATGPDGRTTTWVLLDQAPSEVLPSETAHAARLVASA